MKTMLRLLLLLSFSSALAEEPWISTGKDPAYPANRYFVGIGMSEKSQSAARENAIVEVRKQISVSISATSTDSQTSVTKGRKETYTSRTESSTKLTVSGDVQGIEVVKSAQSKKKYFSLAVLDKGKFESASRLKMNELRKQLVTIMEQAKGDVEGSRPAAALAKLATATDLLNSQSRERTLLSAVARLSDDESLVITPVDILLLYEQCLSSLSMEKSDGDGQSVAIGRSLQKPFSLTVHAGGEPAHGIPLILTDRNGVERAAGATDESGMVTLSPAGLSDLTPGRHTFTASIALAVSKEYRKTLESMSQSFACIMVSNPVFARIDVSVGKDIESAKNKVVKSVIALLSKYDIKHDPRAASALSLKVSCAMAAAPRDGSRSKTASDTAKLSVTLQDEDGRAVVTTELSGTGSGPNPSQALLAGIDAVRMEGKFDQVFDYLSKDKQAAEGPRLKIAISPFKVKEPENCAGCGVLAENLTTMVTSGMVKMDRVTVVEREFLDRIMAEINLQSTDLFDSPEDEETGDDTRILANARLAGAKLLFLGTIGMSNGKIEIDARIVDVADGAARCSMTRAALTPNEARAIADDLVSQIRGKCLR